MRPPRVLLVRLGILVGCAVGFLEAADSADFLGARRDSLEVKSLVVESLAVAPGDGRQVGVLSELSGRSPSLYLFDVTQSATLFLGVVESGSPVISAQASNKEAIGLNSSSTDQCALDLRSLSRLDGIKLKVEKGEPPSLVMLGERGEPRVSLAVLGSENNAPGISVFGASGGQSFHLLSSPAISHALLADGEGQVRLLLGLPSREQAEFSEFQAKSDAPRIRLGWDRGGKPAVTLDDPTGRGVRVLP